MDAPVYGRRTNFFWYPFCRINAAFHLATERRIYAAAKNCVVHPNNNHATLPDSGSVELSLTVRNTGQADSSVAIIGLPCSTD